MRVVLRPKSHLGVSHLLWPHHSENVGNWLQFRHGTGVLHLLYTRANGIFHSYKVKHECKIVFQPVVKCASKTPFRTTTAQAVVLDPNPNIIRCNIVHLGA